MCAVAEGSPESARGRAGECGKRIGHAVGVRARSRGECGKRVRSRGRSARSRSGGLKIGVGCEVCLDVGIHGEQAADAQCAEVEPAAVQRDGDAAECRLRLRQHERHAEFAEAQRDAQRGGGCGSLRHANKVARGSAESVSVTRSECVRGHDLAG